MAPVIELRDPTVKGEKYARGFRASVVGVLGAKAPPVSSRGRSFMHRARWTARAVVGEMCKWAAANKDCVPTRNDVRTWVTTANAVRVHDPEILIAGVSDVMPLRVALGLTGGAYHEAFHGRYSCMRDLRVDEIAQIILPRWALVKDWSKYHGLLQTWNNIVEDIRIERLGRVEYPGSMVKLHDLQDFILDQETKGRNDVRAHGGHAPQGALSVVLSTFRDVGLGYHTLRQRTALEGYRAANAEAVDFVLNGPLAPMLRESIDLSEKDDLGCIRVAFDVIAKLVESGKDSQEGEDAKGGQPGDGKRVCPKCGAPANKLIVRPKSDGQGGKIPNKGICTCTKCGHQEEVDLQPPQAGKPQKPQPTPNFEGFDKDEDQDQSGGGDDAEDGGDDPGDSEDGSGDGDDSEDGDDTGKGKGKKSDDGDDSKDGSGDGDDSEDGDGDDSEEGSPGEDGDDGSPGKDGDESEDGRDGPDDSEIGDKGGDVGSPGGGYHHDEDPVSGDNFEDVANDALADADKELDILDNNSALEEAVEDVQEDADRNVKPGEAPWRPYDQSLDDVIIVKPSTRGKENDAVRAAKILASVREECSFLRARMRNIIRALEMTNVVHGLPKGRRLSQRFLVDTKVTLMAGAAPKRAYKATDEQIETSMASAIVLDESSSMDDLLEDATRVLCALVEPMEAVGAKVQASGFRNGRGTYYRGNPTTDGGTYHRTNGIIHDVFKTFDEKFTAVRWRFANTRACGGTPMADGIQFGLDSLSPRDEAHRFMFIVTDGEPDWGHEEIIRRQVRLAKEAGIHVVGVGIGHGSTSVKTLFPDYVWAGNVSGLPKLIINKLNELIDNTAAKRGRRMKKTG